MLAALALALAVPAAEADARPYPLHEVLDAFATACSGVESEAVNRASFLAAGWEEYEASDDRLGEIIAYGKRVIKEEALDEGEEPSALLPGATFRKEVAGQQLHAAMSQVRIGEYVSSGCRVYDFDAGTAPDAAAVERWATRMPNAIRTPAEGLVNYIWNPGLKPGHMEMEITFVAPGANPMKEVPLEGLVMTALAMEIEGL